MIISPLQEMEMEMEMEMYAGAMSPYPIYIHTGDGKLEEFVMYTYKVRRCFKNKSHDWSNCPYAHRGEKARRRDPRKFPYHGISCPEYRASGECRRGMNCEYAHGVFEFWLHPTRYRTRLCEAGMACHRKVCFFAHNPGQLRPEVIQDCFNFKCKLHGHVTEVPSDEDGTTKVASLTTCEMNSKVVANVSQVKEGEDEEYDFPHIDWILEIVK